MILSLSSHRLEIEESLSFNTFFWRVTATPHTLLHPHHRPACADRLGRPSQRTPALHPRCRNRHNPDPGGLTPDRLAVLPDANPKAARSPSPRCRASLTDAGAGMSGHPYAGVGITAVGATAGISTPVPSPGTLALFGFGLIALGGMFRRKYAA